MSNETKKEKLVMLELTTNLNYQELAKELDVSERTIYNWRKDADFQKMKEKIVKEQFSDMAAKALKSLFELSQGAASELVRYQASSDLLDRAGYKPTDKKELTHSGLNITIGDYDDDD